MAPWENPFILNRPIANSSNTQNILIERNPLGMQPVFHPDLTG